MTDQHQPDWGQFTLALLFGASLGLFWLPLLGLLALKLLAFFLGAS